MKESNLTMPMPKNTAKRNEILNCAFQLISETEYNKVFLRDIAEKANINKSLLQHYFPKKSDIIENILDDLLELSFRYVEYIVPENESMHLRLSVYTSLFWEMVSNHDRLNNFATNIISEREILNIWINIVYKWLRTFNENGESRLSDDNLKAALAFSIAGGLELYLYRDEMQIDVMFICRHITASFMNILNISDKEIKRVLSQAKLVLEKLDIQEFNVYCRNNIEWFPGVSIE